MGKPEGKIRLGRARSRLADYIKIVLGLGTMDWIDLA